MNVILKYALFGLIGAVIAIVVLYSIGRPSAQPVCMLIGLTAAGAIAEFLKQRRDK